MGKRPDRGIKKSAFSCEPCRTRKVKCGGERPHCERCLHRGDDCQYKLGPTLSYTQRLEAKVRELQNLLNSAAQNGDQTLVSNDIHARHIFRDNTPPSSCSERLTMDDTGRVSFHGPTSIFNAPLTSPNNVDNVDDVTLTACVAENERAEQRREQLVTNAWIQRAAEAISSDVVSNLFIYIDPWYAENEQGPFPRLLQYLLDFHWTWIQPIFNFVYRPAFTRDMKEFGSCYSHTLLSAILSHSIRWCRTDPNILEALEPYESGNLFSYHARTLLHTDLQNGTCDIPTIQTLLLVSAQECGQGNCTQAWMYSGIAFRLAEDLGITIDARKYAGSVTFSDEDIEIRNRLFWSCYIWDKMISLYMGRRPLIHCSDVSPPQAMTDDFAEYDTWIPHGMSPDAQSMYPAIQSHAVSTFIWTCKLVEIIHQLLAEVYNPLKHETRDQVISCLTSQKRALEQWSKALPDCLRLTSEGLPSHSPPNHIVCLNCLYHTTNILIHRPMVAADNTSSKAMSSSDAFATCVSSASAICVIFDLFCRSFGDGHCTMALAYSLYTSSLIFLLQLESGTHIDSPSLKGLQYCVRALQKISAVHAVLRRPLQLLRIQLVQRQIDITAECSDSSEAVWNKQPTPEDSYEFPWVYQSLSPFSQPAPALLDN